jgi:hypothetical protein
MSPEPAAVTREPGEFDHSNQGRPYVSSAAAYGMHRAKARRRAEDVTDSAQLGHPAEHDATAEPSAPAWNGCWCVDDNLSSFPTWRSTHGIPHSR